MGCAVAIVDDDEAVRDSLQWLLEAERYDARSYATAGDFLARLGAGEVPDCIVLDIHIPDANGLEVQCRVRERYPDLPVVFMTGYPEHRLADQVRALQPAGFFAKPLDPAGLLGVLEDILRDARWPAAGA